LELREYLTFSSFFVCFFFVNCRSARLIELKNTVNFFDEIGGAFEAPTGILLEEQKTVTQECFTKHTTFSHIKAICGAVKLNTSRFELVHVYNNTICKGSFLSTMHAPIVCCCCHPLMRTLIRKECQSF